MQKNENKSHAKLSASGSHRWLACPGSVLAESFFEDSSSIYTEEGTAMHLLAEYCFETGVIAADCIGQTFNNVVMTAENCSHVQTYIDYILSLPHQHLMIEQKVDFSPWVPDGFGTCDAILINDNDLHVIDFKSGRSHVDVNMNTQGLLYALGAYNDFSMLFNLDFVVIHIVQPRANNINFFEINVKDLLIWAEEIRPKALATLEPTPIRTPGSKQCQFCKAKKTCPEFNEMKRNNLVKHFDLID